MSQSNDPWWLSWVLPVITGGGVVIAFFRRYFSIEARHQENKAAFAVIDQKLEEASKERGEMRTHVNQIAQDVAFLRGRIEQ